MFFSRSWALAVLLVLLACGSAAAAPVTVQLRVEGSTSTLYEGPVTTDGHTIDKGDGPHPCDGTTRTTPPLNAGPGPTMTSALDDASRAAGFSWGGTWFSFGDFSVDRIGPDAADLTNNHFWGYALNYITTSVGGCQQQVNGGDELLFGYDYFSKTHLLKLDGPPRAAVGRAFNVKATDGGTGEALAGAGISGAAGVATGADGSASVSFDSAGLRALKAERADSIRSNAVKVCVSDTGTGDCGVPPSTLGAGPPAVKDSRAPLARISGLVDGRTYGRGPRILRGVASDAETAVTEVKLAFRRHFEGRCQWWSGRREKFVGSNCHKKFFFGIGRDASWSYLLPHSLAPGRYVLDVKAFDRAGNRDERFERGRNRIVFYVASKRRAGAKSSARRAAAVDVMIVGKDRTLASAGTVRARASLVRAGRRTCKVGAATPLAALLASLRRAHAGYRIRDFGDCSRRTAAGSGQLYVSRIGAERGRGNDGWFYKVNDRAPEVGAGDPSAATLRRGDRVLWFYCVFDEGEKSCQRSLRLLPVSGAAGGNAVRVRVRGYDNIGRSAGVSGATVKLGESSGLSGADGIATVAVPDGAPAGHPALVAEKSGMVPSFPLGLDEVSGR